MRIRAMRRVWELADAVGVAWALRRLKRQEVVYVHPSDEAPAAAVLVRVETWESLMRILMRVAGEDGIPDDHAHVEGRVRRG